MDIIQVLIYPDSKIVMIYSHVGISEYQISVIRINLDDYR